MIDIMKTATEHREMVGRNVMLVREALGMRQGDFARSIGITAPALWNIETGRAYPSYPVLVRICDEHGVTADWLLRGQRGALPRALADSLRAADTALSR